MTYLSIFDKLKILFTSIIDFKGILIFSIFMIVLTVLFVLKKMTAKRYTIGMALSLILLLLISILSNLKIFSNTFENFTTIFFRGIYFPSIYLYLSTLLIVLIAFIVSILNIKIKKVYKIINRIMFVLNSMMFVIILNIVAKYKIDIFSLSSLYTNKNLVALLEVSMGLFLIWIASLIVTYTTNCICDRIANKKVLPVEDSIIEENIEEIKETSSIKNKNSVVEAIKDKKEEMLLAIKNKQTKKLVTSEPVKVIVNTNNIDETPSIRVINDNAIPVEYNNYYENYMLEKPTKINYNILKDEATQTLTDNLVINNIETSFDNTSDEVITTNNIELIEAPAENDHIISEIETSKVNSINEDKEDAINEAIKKDDVSLNSLAEEVIEEETSIYTLEDYKKIMDMLKSLKNQSIGRNITIDDAVAISLISNYSIDDCLKFKDILESNLN